MTGNRKQEQKFEKIKLQGGKGVGTHPRVEHKQEAATSSAAALEFRKANFPLHTKVVPHPEQVCPPSERSRTRRPAMYVKAVAVVRRMGTDQSLQ